MVDPEHRIPSPPRSYWSAQAIVEEGQAVPFDGSEQDAVNRALDGLLRNPLPSA